MATSSRSPSRRNLSTDIPPSRDRGPVGALTTAALALVVALAGCAAPLPYRPERQPFGATISADVRVSDDRLRVEIDSEGYRVELAVLVRDGDMEVAPEALVPPTAGPTGGLSVGLGVGAAGWGSRGSYSVGTGIGIGLGGPRPEGTTLAVFRLDEAGVPPWRLRVKVVGVEAVDIVLDPSRSGRP
jgi:hypothetical protein